MKPSEVLREARALLEPRGAWIQGQTWNDDDSAHCAVGALRHVEQGECRIGGWLVTRSTFARAYLERAVDDWWVAGWNDAPSCRKHQVLAAFDRAIALAESEDQ